MVFQWPTRFRRKNQRRALVLQGGEVVGLVTVTDLLESYRGPAGSGVSLGGPRLRVHERAASG
jgi:Mg2+/Co2+ transporter CorB